MLLLNSIHFFHCLRCTSACTKIVNVKNKNGSGDIFHSKTKKRKTLKFSGDGHYRYEKILFLELNARYMVHIRMQVQEADLLNELLCF